MTEIYSFLPATFITPVQEREQFFLNARQKFPRDAYACLPWQMEELAGTAWRNGPTGLLRQIESVELGQFTDKDKLVAYFLGPYEWKDKLGFWWTGRYVIEGWIRVDHWTAEQQLQWFAPELAYHRLHIEKNQQDILDMATHPERQSCLAENRNMRYRDLQSHQKELANTIQRMNTFAQTHSLIVPLELLNSGVIASKQPAQLTMF